MHSSFSTPTATSRDDDRWLARRVLTGRSATLVDALPAPVRVSIGAARDAAVRDYVLWWALHPDPAGAFSSRNNWLQRLPKRWLLRILLARRYDGLVYSSAGRIFGHVFYQRHGDELHGFSTASGAQAPARGLSVVIMLDFVALAWRTPGIVRARVGRGENVVTRRLLERVHEQEASLGWRVRVGEGWVDFRI